MACSHHAQVEFLWFTLIVLKHATVWIGYAKLLLCMNGVCECVCACPYTMSITGYSLRNGVHLLLAVPLKKL